MRTLRSRRLLVALLSLPVVIGLLVADGRSTAQEKKEDQAAEKKERTKPRGRLPAYFSAVVSEEQREQIYGVQQKYAKQIDELERQLDELVAQRDKEVEGVLTPEQLEKVIAKREEAAAKRRQPQDKTSDNPKKGDSE